MTIDGKSRGNIFSTALIVSLSACSPSEADGNAGSSSSANHGVPAVSYRNPAPKEAYTITMTLNDAPGPFAFMKGLAQYDVVNRECLRPPKDNPGGHTAPVPTDDVEIPLRRISETEYEATVYADQMLDHDFAGRGFCHWKLIQFRVHMKATGDPAETLFIASIPDDKLRAESSAAVYFNRRAYPRDEVVKDYPYAGRSVRADFADSIKNEDLFAVVFDAKKDAGHAN